MVVDFPVASCRLSITRQLILTPTESFSVPAIFCFSRSWSSLNYL